MITVAEMMKKYEENGGKFPAGASEVITPPSEELVLHAAKTELRRVAMVLHAEARAILQNVFLCPADVSDAIGHLNAAWREIEDSLHSPKVINARNLPNK